MSDVMSKTPMPAEACRGRKPAVRTMRYLAVVDGTETTNRIVDFLVAAVAGRQDAGVVVLNVQEMHGVGRLRGYGSFKKEEVEDRLLKDVGSPIVNSVANWLRKSGIAAATAVKIGDPLDVVLDCAAKQDCDAIVIGAAKSKGIGAWMRAVLGLPHVALPAMRLVARSTLPVVVVK